MKVIAHADQTIIGLIVVAFRFLVAEEGGSRLFTGAPGHFFLIEDLSCMGFWPIFHILILIL